MFENVINYKVGYFRNINFHSTLVIIYISGVQISFRRLTKAGVTSKFWLKLTDVERHYRKVGRLKTT